MTPRRIGLWLIGACGGVASTVALGLAAWAKRLIEPTGIVTALPPFAALDLDPPEWFVVGGHEVRRATFASAVRELHERSRVFDERLLAACYTELEQWSAHIRPGILYQPNPTLQRLSDRADVRQVDRIRPAVAAIQEDWEEFRRRHMVDQLIVVNAASTEPPFAADDRHASLIALEAAIDREEDELLPASSLYAYAALDAGYPYINITPSCGASLPALEELALRRGVPHAGQDLKTGETLLKSVLAPLLTRRNLRVLSWVGHNILGNRDGLVLNDPQNKASKLKTKDALLGELLGYRPQSIVSIEYVASLDDWKTAWDHVHFEGFLGTKMVLQFIWQGCDSLLAAPLVLDLVRLVALAQRRGERGPLPWLASFFKSPLGTSEHDFFRQFDQLLGWVRTATSSGSA